MIHPAARQIGNASETKQMCLRLSFNVVFEFPGRHYTILMTITNATAFGASCPKGDAACLCLVR
jgi:hypothetical protein